MNARAANRFRSPDGRFGAFIEERTWKRLYRLCESAAPEETGGILIGRYNGPHDCAMVTKVTGPPPDSKAGKSWFHRGVLGLQALLNRVWRSTETFYLGEWHFHPNAAPNPSSTDRTQLAEIRDSNRYARPEPLLLIIGGGPEGEWTKRVFVFPRGARPVELFPIGAERSDERASSR